MSVGVCIINRNDIALAADSAGTYTGNKMFYNSMNKVFSLSRKYVYGAITYGASNFLGTSAEHKNQIEPPAELFFCLRNFYARACQSCARISPHTVDKFSGRKLPFLEGCHCAARSGWVLRKSLPL